jgi:SAM-dependent methyltransferase
MADLDDLAQRNRRAWEQDVRRAGPYTTPWLNLDRHTIQVFIDGRVEFLPEPYAYIYPREVLQEVSGKEVLCLASGGGQQSAVFGLLGARVTALDVTEGQLAGDRRCAEHYGYKITTVQGDMRDLTRFAPASFDLVYQAISLCFIPDVRPVYREVARVLRPGGTYRVGQSNPATYLIDDDSWDGAAYRINEPYRGGPIPGSTRVEMLEFRHLFSDIFNGLVAAGLIIAGVWEDPRHLRHDPQALPGRERHLLNIVQKYFCILARQQ